MDTKIALGDKGDGNYFRVLIVDDSVFIVKQLTQIFLGEKFEVVGTATDGEEGFEKYKELSPNIDIVTLDITMPKMDGLQALEKIIEFDKNANVLMVSALGKEDLVKRALLAGAKNYILKPIDRRNVLEKIESLIHGVKK